MFADRWIHPIGCISSTLCHCLDSLTSTRHFCIPPQVRRCQHPSHRSPTVECRTAGSGQSETSLHRCAWRWHHHPDAGVHQRPCQGKILYLVYPQWEPLILMTLRASTSILCVSSEVANALVDKAHTQNCIGLDKHVISLQCAVVMDTCGSLIYEFNSSRYPASVGWDTWA